MELLDQIKENAKKQNKTIVLPEGTEERTIQAANQIIGEGIAKIILIGNPSEIKALAEKYQLKNIDKASIIDPQTHAKKEQYGFETTLSYKTFEYIFVQNCINFIMQYIQSQGKPQMPIPKRT